MTRLIDAEALKKAFECWKNMDDYYHDTDCNDIPFSEAYDLIDKAPTVTPETKKRCADCQNFELSDARTMIGCCHLLQSLITAGCSACENFKEKQNDDEVHYEDRPHGKWITLKIGATYILYNCNLCDVRNEKKSKFCPNCGADMRGEDNG